MLINSINRRLCFFFLNHLFAGTKYFRIKSFLLSRTGSKVGKNVKIVGPIYVSSKLLIGDNCWIGKNFSCEGNGEVVIGNNCDIAPNVTFLTGGHQLGDATRRAGLGEKYKIIVGNGCWICANSTLVKNISIGDSSVVAACSCVIKDVDSNTIVAGIPAKTIRRLDENV